jgi:hypothetical protein
MYIETRSHFITVYFLPNKSYTSMVLIVSFVDLTITFSLITVTSESSNEDVSEVLAVGLNRRINRSLKSPPPNQIGMVWL